MSLRSTAAGLSKIRKPTSKLKSILSPLKKKPTRPAPHRSKELSQDEKSEALEVTEHNIQMDFELHGLASMAQVLDMVIDNQWAESTLLHSRYYSREAKRLCLEPSDLLFLLRGLSMETKAAILSYRRTHLPAGGLATLNQLYSMHGSRGNTFVDRTLELSVREGSLRKFVISNAQPVILSLGKGGPLALVTYGYENAEVVVKTEQYVAEILARAQAADPAHSQTLLRFQEFVESNPTTLFVTSEDFDAADLTILVKLGFLTLTSNHHHEIDTHQYSVAYPRCGTFLKMVNAGRSWVVKTLGKTAYKECLEEALFDKWEGKNLNNFRKPFYGYDLLWILADAKGAGVIEAFNTPVGKGWRLTGKLK